MNTLAISIWQPNIRVMRRTVTGLVLATAVALGVSVHAMAQHPTHVHVIDVAPTAAVVGGTTSTTIRF